jgi:rubrerythrin
MPLTTMRIRPLRRTRSDTRRVHQVPPPAPRPEPVHPAERRLRDAGGPDDRETYTCSCGYVFEAQVTAGVACPNCGGGQAW